MIALEKFPQSSCYASHRTSRCFINTHRLHNIEFMTSRNRWALMLCCHCSSASVSLPYASIIDLRDGQQFSAKAIAFGAPIERTEMANG